MSLITWEAAVRLWPLPNSTSDKYSRGVVGLDTGSGHYPGAALLGCAGALHSGAGMVRYVGPAPGELILSRFPSVVVGQGRVQSLVIGSGWGDDDQATRFAAAVERGVPLVVDADALRQFPAELPANSLLTPHAGELARLLGVERGAVEADPRGHALRAADQFGVTVLLKGGAQFVATSGGDVRFPVPGPAWTAQAGSGDVLAGVCGTLLAAGLEAAEAALLAASLQAVTAARYPGPRPPDQLAKRFADVLGDLI